MDLDRLYAKSTDGQTAVRLTEWDANLYDEGHSFGYDYGEDVVGLLAPEAGERVLDLGCGTGHQTAQIAKASAPPIGLDSDSDMTRRAVANYPDVPFVCGDARALPFYGGTFDAVFSNATLHWIDEHEAAIASIADVLKPGGRIVAEFGGHGNVASIADALEAEVSERGYDISSPWYFPRIGEYTSALEAHGFLVTYARLIERPTELDGGDDGLENWIRMFGGAFLDPLSDEETEEVVSAVETELRPEQFVDGAWIADYTRLRFAAVLEPE